MSGTTSTRDIWLATFLLVNGLEFRRATALPGPHFSVDFFFADPEGRAPVLTRRFRTDVTTQRLIDSRRALSEILSVVRSRGTCEAADVAVQLQLAEVPWAKRARGSRNGGGT